MHSTFLLPETGHSIRLAMAITSGPEVGNHTWNHLDLTRQPDDIVREEISRAEILLTDQPEPVAELRAPSARAIVLSIAANLG